MEFLTLATFRQFLSVTHGAHWYFPDVREVMYMPHAPTIRRITAAVKVVQYVPLVFHCMYSVFQHF